MPHQPNDPESFEQWLAMSNELVIPQRAEDIRIVQEAARSIAENLFQREEMNNRDLALYYANTVNIAKGKVCKISHSTEGGMICRPINGGKAFVTKEITPLNDVITGLINTPVGVVKCFRKPTRTAKEGINCESIQVEFGVVNPWDDYPVEFLEMLDNKYPSKEEAIQIAKENKITVAISKTVYYHPGLNRFIDAVTNSEVKERKKYALV